MLLSVCCVLELYWTACFQKALEASILTRQGWIYQNNSKGFRNGNADYRKEFIELKTFLFYISYQ
jgi:hypothetical protein